MIPIRPLAKCFSSSSSQFSTAVIFTPSSITYSGRRYSSAPVRADYEVDHLIIGCGVVGLAIGARLCQTFPTRTTLLVDQHPSIGAETSSRNSEVIHGGIYYPVDSMKSKLCVRGATLLYERCKARSIPHAQVGKWIVASSSSSEHRKLQEAKLDGYARRAKAVGVDTYFLNEAEAKKMEPHVFASKVLVSPRSGIVDSRAFMNSLHEDIGAQHHGIVSLNTQVLGIWRHSTSSGYHVQTKSADGSTSIIHARTLINSAGLHADKIASMIIPQDRLRTEKIDKIYYCKGHYYTYSGAPLVSRLVYPIPDPNLTGLGIHATVDTDGRLKFGPDTLYIDQIDYSMSGNETPEGDARRRHFFECIQSYIPTVQLSKLMPDYSGIRSKLSGPGQPARDFYIGQVTDYPGLINLFGIESPGLTSSLAIAEYVEELLVS